MFLLVENGEEIIVGRVRSGCFTVLAEQVFHTFLYFYPYLTACLVAVVHNVIALDVGATEVGNIDEQHSHRIE